MSTLTSPSKTSTADVVIYCVGMWAPCRIKEMKYESQVFQVNLTAAIQLLETVVPLMVQRHTGQVLILSSVADEIFSPDNPAYASSKAGLSRYVESLALRLRKHNVYMTICVLVVDTKLASAPVKPFEMNQITLQHVLKALKKKQCYSTPLQFLVRLMHWWGRLRTFGLSTKLYGVYHAKWWILRNSPTSLVKFLDKSTVHSAILRCMVRTKKPLKSAKGKLRWRSRPTPQRTARCA